MFTRERKFFRDKTYGSEKKPNFSEKLNKLKNKVESNQSTERDNLMYAKMKIRDNYRKSGIMKRINPKNFVASRRTIRKSHINRILAGRADKSTKLTNIQNHTNNLVDKTRN